MDNFNLYYYFLFSTVLQLSILILSAYAYLNRMFIRGEVSSIETIVKPFEETKVKFSVQNNGKVIDKFERENFRFVKGEAVIVIKRPFRDSWFIIESRLSRQILSVVLASTIMSISFVLLDYYNVIALTSNQYYLKYPFLFVAYALFVVAFYEYKSAQNLFVNGIEANGFISKQIVDSSTESHGDFISKVHFMTNKQKEVVVYLKDIDRSNESEGVGIIYHPDLPEIVCFKEKSKYGYSIFPFLAGLIFLIIFLFAPV